MILKRVRLESFRCFAAPVEVGPLDERITVLYGPNGAGKSTFLTALERALFDRPDGQSSEIEALTPWGGAVMPRVTVDFSSNARHFRLEKTFGPRGETALHELEGGRLRPFREGSAAVEWVRELLGGRPPGRGVSKPEHRGLAQLLFMPQGSLALPEKLGEGALDRLRSVVGQVVVDPATRAIEEQIRRRHEELFTGGGKPRKGAPLPSIDEQLEGARAAVEEAGAAWLRLADLRHQLDVVTAEAQTIDTRRRALTGERERLKPRVQELRRLGERRDQARRDLESAERAFGEIAERIQRIEDLERERAELELKQKDRRADAEAESLALDEARRAQEAATRRRQEHESGRTRLREMRLHADDARQLERARAELADVRPRFEGWRAAESAAEEKALRLAASSAPSAREIDGLRRALAEEARARAELDLLQLKLRVRALRPVEIVAQGEKAGLAAGEEREWSGEGTLELTVGDSLAIAISGPTRDVARARDAQLAGHEALAERVAALGTASPDELEARRSAQERIARELELERARAQAHLRAGETPAALERQLAAADARARQVLERRPELASGLDAAQLEIVAREAEALFESERERLVGEETRLAGAAVRALERKERAGAARAQGDTDAARISGELRALSDDGLSADDRQQARRVQSAAAQRAEDAVRLAEEAIAELEGDPELELERTLRALDALSTDATRLAQRLGQAEQALADATRAAPYARLAESEERVEVLERERQRARREAESIQLLHRLFVEEHAHTTARLVEPVVARVLPRLQRLAGPRFEGMDLDESFRPSGLRLRGLERAVDPGDLSFGTRDQLAVLVRLGLGELVAQDAPLPAVLDDPLVHADASRMLRFLSLLEESSQKLQLLVLTCRPDDYRGLGVGTFVELGSDAPAPVSGSRAASG